MGSINTTTTMSTLTLLLSITCMLIISSNAAVIRSTTEDRTGLSTCFSTCSAANFASTTSCSFSVGFLVVLTYTNTCNNLFPLLSIINSATSPSPPLQQQST